MDSRSWRALLDGYHLQVKWVEGRWMINQSEDNLLLGLLLNERSENAVPDDKEAGVVLIEAV